MLRSYTRHETYFKKSETARYLFVFVKSVFCGYYIKRLECLKTKTDFTLL